MTSNKPFPCESEKQWKTRAAQAIGESQDMLDKIHPSQRDMGDPNHPRFDGTLGYDKAKFLAKQY